MAEFSTQKQQQEEALRENLYAINYCLEFSKNDSLHFGKNEKGCLGYPAFILLSSIIDTIGSFFRDTEAIIIVDSQPRFIEKASDHFLILNHDKLFNLKLSGTTIYDFYSSFRSKVIHNNSLPKNRFLINDDGNEEIFELNSKEEISAVNLYALNRATEQAVNHFLYWLKYGTFSDNHKLKKELSDQAIPFSSIWVNTIPNHTAPSGCSFYDEQNLNDNPTFDASGVYINDIDSLTFTVSQGKVQQDNDL